MKLNMKKNYSKQKGITLIALVVTIVVLLILAGVTINALFGDTGIIKKAQEAQSKMDQAAENDLTALNDLTKQMNDIVNQTVPVTGVKILCNGVESTGENVSSGATVNLTAKVEPENATNKKVNWSVRTVDTTGIEEPNDVILNVDETTGVATVTTPYMSNGTLDFIVTVTTEDGNKQATYTIHGTFNSCCFVAGTQVLCDLEGNTKNIEDCKEGDTVVSYNVETGENYLAKVKKLIVNPKATNMAKVYLENGTILDMTDYHPLYTKEGFKSITNHMGFATLTEEDYVRTIDGYVKIDRIERYTTEPVITYNVDVIDFDEEIDDGENDNFFANGVVAHNPPAC